MRDVEEEEEEKGLEARMAGASLQDEEMEDVL